MEAVLNLNYDQVLDLVKQLPPRMQLRLGRALTRQATRAELEHFLNTFRTDEISAEDIRPAFIQVRKQRHARRQEKKGDS